MELVFSKKLFNPIYWHLIDAHFDEKIRYIYVYGGSSSGKTYTIAQVQSACSFDENNNTLVLRKESVTIPTTVYESFKSFQKKINESYEFFDFMSFMIRCKNRNQFTFKGVDDPEKVKGLESFNTVFLNELTKFNESDLDEVKRRLRGRPNQKIYADWNPIDESHWIKTNLIDAEEWIELPIELEGKPYSMLDELSGKWINKTGDTILIKTTYRDNHWVIGSPCGSYGFVDEHTISNFEKMRTQKPNQYQVYGLGNWGSYRVGGEFWRSFDIDKHVKKVEYLKGKQIHLTIDINRLPYISQSLWQYKDFKIRQFNELCAEPPENDARRSAQKVIRYLQSIGYNDIIHIYGDASGKNKSATDGESFFDVYIRELRKSFVVNDRILKSNPSVSLSGSFVNEIYEGLTPFSIIIGDNCIKSKSDYNTVKEGMNGEMVKEKIKDSNTGVTYEKSGHLSDAKRYFIVKLLEKEYKDYRSKRKKYAII